MYSFCTFINLKLVAQTFITDNDWDFHLNIRDPLHIVFFDDNIYSFSSNGLFSLDINSKAILRNNNSLNLINLKVVETTKNSEYLILGLQDGNIVIYNSEESHIINLGFDEEEAAINSLNIHDETLYVSTSQGLYLISITEKYIIENVIIKINQIILFAFSSSAALFLTRRIRHLKKVSLMFKFHSLAHARGSCNTPDGTVRYSLGYDHGFSRI